CLARTGAGEEALAAWLNAPADPDEVRVRQDAVAELRDALKAREQMALLTPEGTIDLAGLREWIMAAPAPGPAWACLLAVGLVAALLVALAGWLVLGLSAYPLLAVFAAEAAVASSMRERVRAAVAAVKGRAGELYLLAALLARLERGRFRSPWLSRLQAEL